MATPIHIDYFTDLLCVWAWIVQRRIEQVDTEWRSKVVMKHSCVNVFGDTARRIGTGWEDRGGYDGFANHVEESAAPYETAPINSKVWREVRPATSAQAHLALKAAAIVEPEIDVIDLALRLRRVFFVEALDIGNQDVVLDIAVDAGLDRQDLLSTLASGEALAALQADYEAARGQGIKGSPSWVLNNGRQVLYGNVGYRLINANIEELVKRPQGEASWC